MAAPVRAPISLAEDGIDVTERTSRLIAGAFAEFPEHAKAFYGRGGASLRAGERLVQRDLGRSLRLIARDGAVVVHGGTLGLTIDSAMRATGGFLTVNDLRDNGAEPFTSRVVLESGRGILEAGADQICELTPETGYELSPTMERQVSRIGDGREWRALQVHRLIIPCPESFCLERFEGPGQPYLDELRSEILLLDFSVPLLAVRSRTTVKALHGRPTPSNRSRRGRRSRLTVQQGIAVQPSARTH